MELLAPTSVATLVLLVFRVGGVVLAAPVFSAKMLSVMLKTSIVVVLSWLLHPMALGAVGGEVRLTTGHVLTEMLIGLAMGLGAAVLIGAAEAMGDLLAVHIGLSGASSLDPLTNISVPVLGQFANLFAVTLMLSVDGHLVMLGALAKSLQMIPVGSDPNLAAGASAMVAMGSSLFVIGLRFAAPVLATVLLANVALAILTRAAPQLNILSIAFPIQIAVGLFAFAATIPAIGSFYLGWNGVYNDLIGHVMAAFMGGGGR
jgi:flagellar biosynthetic protein FliR